VKIVTIPTNGSQLQGAEQIEHWPAGKVLFAHGDEPRGVYVIHSGDIDLLFARNGVSKPLQVAHPGDVVGLSNIISNSRYEYSATTRSAARIGFIPVSQFRRLLEEIPSLWFPVLQSLSEDIGSCWDSMRAIAAR
jgi:CRP-like cAMP-binding protein